MNNDITKGIRLLKQEIKYAKTSESDSLTGIIARFNELEIIVKNSNIGLVINCDCKNLPEGEIAISSKTLTDPDWKG